MANKGSIEALDAELACRTEEEGRVGAALVELDSHRGRDLLAAGTLAGETARRWAAAESVLNSLWLDFDRFRGVLAEAREVRALRSRPGERELDKLRGLLRGPSVEIAREAVALPDRLRTPAGQHVERISLAELSSRMDRAFREVSTLVVEVDRAHRAFLAAYAPLAERLHAARALVAELDLDVADAVARNIAELTARAERLETAASTDPMSLDPEATGRVVAELDAELARLTARVAELAVLRDGWSDALAELAVRLCEVAELRARAERAAVRALELIENAHATLPPDRLAGLRVRLDALPGTTGWAARADALRRLRAAVDAATDELNTCHELAVGLVERRGELRGRFEAYRAKAVRLGRAEDPPVLELDRQLHGLLWARPCDLAASTRALADYQRLVVTPAGST